ncbi:MAG: serine hydrolase domain-containing protein [Candidatus Binatia bacterium]
MPTIDRAQVAKLLERARREVDAGFLPSCQIALALEGEIVAAETFGAARPDDRYCIFSATKPFVASTMWTLLGEGKIRLDERVSAYFPEFAANDKGTITVEQVMLHTSGFPHAPMGPPDWYHRAARVRRMSAWKLNWEPGTRYEYHPTSAHWVLGELIERIAGADYRTVVEERVTKPAGLPRILGIPRAQQSGIRDLVLVGEHATPDELEKTFGVRALPETEVTDDAVLQFNRPEVRELGVPGGGGFARAVDLALFYQRLLHDPTGIWDAALRKDATSRVRNLLPDPMGVPANRSLGLILAGDDGNSHIRGLGRTVSVGAFGHNGAGGQLAWADPATGLSLGYVTDGYDRHEIRQPRRGTAISSLAATSAR